MFHALRLLFLLLALLLAGVPDAFAYATRGLENRVWKNFEPMPETALENALQVVEPQQEIWLFIYDPVSGSTVWTKFDPEGLWLEDLVIGVPSIVFGAMSLYDNVRSGNWGGAALDGAGLLLDGGALLAPGIPGGAGLAIKAGRVANTASDGAKLGDVAANGAGLVKAGDGAANAGKAAELPPTGTPQKVPAGGEKPGGPSAKDISDGGGGSSGGGSGGGGVGDGGGSGGGSSGGGSGGGGNGGGSGGTYSPQGGTGNPALRGDPYSPGEVAKRQSETRRQLDTGNVDPESPIPNQGPGHNVKSTHQANQGEAHGTGERNVGTQEEHSRVAKGSHGQKKRR